jgi:hypothetical protein
MFYVDDGLVAAKTTAEADALVDLVGSMFEIRKLGEPEDFLGIHICRDRSAGTITVDQEDKATALAAELGVSGTFRIVPMTPEVFGELRGAQPGGPMADKRRYQQVVGSLLHLAQCTRPDIALWGFLFGFALRRVALLCGVFVQLHLALFPAGGPFLPPLSVNRYCATDIALLVPHHIFPYEILPHMVQRCIYKVWSDSVASTA